MMAQTRRALTLSPLLPALACVALLFLYPLASGLVDSLGRYHEVLSNPELRATIARTFGIAAPVTLAAVGIAAPLAYWMRKGLRFERLITSLLILPMALGNVLVALGMLSYFGRQGWFNQLLVALHVVAKDAPLPLTYNYVGVEIGLFLQTFPFIFMLVLGFMSGIDESLLQSARMLGANSWQIFWRVVLPLSLPGILTAASLGFIATFSVYPTAVLVGQPMGETKTMAIAAYTAAFEAFDFSQGNAIAFVMGAIQLAVVALLALGKRKQPA
jgi:putative spermidine/putrescine transport system permease protein